MTQTPVKTPFFLPLGALRWTTEQYFKASLPAHSQKEEETNREDEAAAEPAQTRPSTPEQPTPHHTCIPLPVRIAGGGGIRGAMNENYKGQHAFKETEKRRE